MTGTLTGAAATAASTAGAVGWARAVAANGQTEPAASGSLRNKGPCKEQPWAEPTKVPETITSGTVQVTTEEIGQRLRRKPRESIARAAKTGRECRGRFEKSG